MVNSKLIINLDILFLNDLVMTLVLLWATARLVNLKVKFWRVMLAGFIGALYTVLLVLPFLRMLPTGIYLVVHILLNLAVAVLMVRTAFGPLKLKKFVKILGNFYLITFLAGGVALSIYFIAGSTPTQWIFGWIGLDDAYTWLYLAAAGVALMVGRYGWNILKEKLYREKCHYKFRVVIADKEVEVQGLMDTGNLLKDPITNLPVIVVEIGALEVLFPQEIKAVLAEAKLDVVDKVDRLLHTEWYSRFRIIPFTSLGSDGGLMIGLRPDRVEILGEAKRETGRVMLALHQGELDLEGDYRALLHPELLEAM